MTKSVEWTSRRSTALVCAAIAIATAACANGEPLSIADAGHKPAAETGAIDAGTIDEGVALDDGITAEDDGTPIDAPIVVDETPAIDDAGMSAEVSTGGCATSVAALATFDFSGLAGDEASVDAASTASGVTAGALTRGPGLVAITGSGSINASGWSMGASDDKSTYYSARITPPAGCAIDLAGVTLSEKSSGTGPARGDIGTDVDAFGALATFTANTSATVTLSAVGAPGAAIEIRVFGFGATSSGGTMRLTGTLTISGALH